MVPRLKSQEVSALKSVYTKTCSFPIQGLKFWPQKAGVPKARGDSTSDHLQKV